MNHCTNLRQLRLAVPMIALIICVGKHTSPLQLFLVFFWAVIALLPRGFPRWRHHGRPCLRTRRRGCSAPTRSWDSSTKTNAATSREKVSVLRNLIATWRGCRGPREIDGEILPHFSGSQLAGCASEGRGNELSGRSQLRDIGLPHAAHVTVFEGASTSPFYHFANGFLLGRGKAPCRRQELVAELVESRTCSRPVAIVGRWRRGGLTGVWFGKSVPTRNP